MEVRFRDGGAEVFARRPIREGEPVLRLRGMLRPLPGRHTLQVSATAHLAPHSDAPDPATDPWCFVNHACAPNLEADLARGELRALRPIAIGEELTLDYDLTEWDIAHPFRCRCGARDCRGIVRGFRYMEEGARRERLPRAAPHIRELDASRRAPGATE